MLANYIYQTLNVLLPQHCIVCTRRIYKGVLCTLCYPDSNEFVVPGRQREVQHLWWYQGKARDLIRTMKFKPSRKLCYLAGQILAARIDRMFTEPTWDLIVPIPGSKASLNKRGFNQCDYLVEALRKHGKPGRHALVHNGYTHTQAGLTFEERARNMEGVFTIAKPKQILGKRILLVDDVRTTGSTIRAAQSTLYAGDVKSVDTVCLAATESQSVQGHS